ncbi:MAG: PEP-CTERM sorting domain-containing protein [Phycisphaerales bacterium]|jgi:hypothetical protein|nr:PEP-CTERM sorting domain-containing protein [Phycisphaerales bacterium]
MSRSWIGTRAMCLLVLGGMAGHARCGPYDGLFFHTFTGAVDGSEWSTWGPLPGEGRHEFSDLNASGHYPATIDASGGILLDAGRGTGSFSGTDEGDISFTLGGTNFQSHFERAAYTDERFPVFFTGAVQGDGALAGAWSARVREVDPSDGATLHETQEMWGVEIGGTTVRLTEPGGTFTQGVWVGEDQGAFRVIGGRVSDARYATFPGSAASGTVDVVGELRILAPDHMRFIVVTQTRAPLGSQVQRQRVIDLTRVPAPGSVGVLCATAGLGINRRRRR